MMMMMMMMMVVVVVVTTTTMTMRGCTERSHVYCWAWEGGGRNNYGFEGFQTVPRSVDGGLGSKVGSVRN